VDSNQAHHITRSPHHNTTLPDIYLLGLRQNTPPTTTAPPHLQSNKRTTPNRNLVTPSRNALVLNLYDWGILSVRRQTGAWVNVSWEAPPSPAVGCRISDVHSLIPPRAPKELGACACVRVRV
jgi:hypothetical protein